MAFFPTKADGQAYLKACGRGKDANREECNRLMESFRSRFGESVLQRNNPEISVRVLADHVRPFDPAIDANFINSYCLLNKAAEPPAICRSSFLARVRQQLTRNAEEKPEEKIVDALNSLQPGGGNPEDDCHRTTQSKLAFDQCIDNFSANFAAEKELKRESLGGGGSYPLPPAKGQGGVKAE
jgi:hypothetical protein